MKKALEKSKSLIDGEQHDLTKWFEVIQKEIFKFVRKV